LGVAVAQEIPDVEPIETTTRTLAFEWDDPPAADDRDSKSLAESNEE
jgi:hypothetical protein